MWQVSAFQKKGVPWDHQLLFSAIRWLCASLPSCPDCCCWLLHLCPGQHERQNGLKRPPVQCRLPASYCSQDSERCRPFYGPVFPCQPDPNGHSARLIPVYQRSPANRGGGPVLYRNQHLFSPPRPLSQPHECVCRRHILLPELQPALNNQVSRYMPHEVQTWPLSCRSPRRAISQRTGCFHPLPFAR